MFKSKVFWSLNQTHWCSTRHVHVKSISSSPVILAYTHRSKDTRRIHLDACNVSSSDFEYFVVSETMSNAKAYISFWFGLEMMKTWQSYLESGPGWTQLTSEAGLWWWRSLDCFIFLMMWYPQKYPLLTSNCDALHCVINLQCW